MSESRDSTRTSLFKNPWFYGFVVLLAGFFFVQGALTPNIRDPWFWQTADRTVEGSTTGTAELLRQLEKHPEDRAIGNPSAPVTITEFSNLQCKPCRRFSRQYFPLILRDYVRSGRVYYRIRHLPVPDKHPLSPKLALGAECAADQDAFWAYHHEMIQDTNTVTPEDILDMAGPLEMPKPAEYRQCVQNKTHKQRINKDIRLSRTRSVRTIPTLFINDRKVSEIRSYRQLRGLIDRALQTGGLHPDTG